MKNHKIVYVLMEQQEAVAVYTSKDLAEKDCWDCNNEAGYTDDGQHYPDFWITSAPLCEDEE